MGGSITLQAVTYLSFREVEVDGYFIASQPGQIVVVCELWLQLSDLFLGEGCALLPGFAVHVWLIAPVLGIWNEKQNIFQPQFDSTQNKREERVEKKKRQGGEKIRGLINGRGRVEMKMKWKQNYLECQSRFLLWGYWSRRLEVAGIIHYSPFSGLLIWHFQSKIKIQDCTAYNASRLLNNEY